MNIARDPHTPLNRWGLLVGAGLCLIMYDAAVLRAQSKLEFRVLASTKDENDKTAVKAAQDFFAKAQVVAELKKSLEKAKAEGRPPTLPAAESTMPKVASDSIATVL